MRLQARVIVLISLCFSGPFLGAAKYKARDLQLLSPLEYQAHQQLQSISLGAYPCETLAKTLELFDTKKLYEKNFVPVLLVIENQNAFPIQVDENDIYLIGSDGRQHQTLPYSDVLIEIGSDKPLSKYTGEKDLLARQSVKKEIYTDFVAKSFGRKTIGPSEVGHGVLFFRFLTWDELKASRLYLPEIINSETREPMIFVEFELYPASP